MIIIMISMSASGKIFDVDGFADEILGRIAGKPPTSRRRTSCESQGSVDTAALSDSADSDDSSSSGEEEKDDGGDGRRGERGFLVSCEDVTLRFEEDVMKRCRSLSLAQSDCDRGRQEEDDDGKWQDVRRDDSSVDEDLEALNETSVQYEDFSAWNSFRETLTQERQAALRQSIANGRRLLWQPSSSSCSESFDEDDGGGRRHDR